MPAGANEPFGRVRRQSNGMRFTLQNTVLARLVICLLVGISVFWGSFGAIGLAGKVIHDGWAEAVAGMMRAIASLTFPQCARLIGLATGVCLIACFPVYFARASASLVLLFVCAIFAALMIAGTFAFEAWYWWGRLDFPPPALVSATAFIAIATSLASRAIVARLENLRE